MNEVIIIAFLILLNGVLSMAEMAVVSARKAVLANEEKQGDKAAKVALQLANKPDSFFSTIQIGITAVGILTGLYSGSVLADDFKTLLVDWGVDIRYAAMVAQTTIVVIVTYFTLILGELVPKRIGLNRAEQTAKLIAKPMHALSLIAMPCVWLLTKSTSIICNALGLKGEVARITEAEIKSMIEEGTKEGTVQEMEQDILERVFLLGDLKVNSLMTHRSDVVALDVNMTPNEVKQIMQEYLHDMYPVIDRTFDDVKGIVSLKELIFKLDQPDFVWQKVIMPPLSFHENQSIYQALENMKNKRASQALIYDEFGTCQGVITLRDIMEGLVGTIEDIHTEPDIIKRKDNTGWLIDGQCPFYDFLSYFECEELYDADSDYSTLAGLIIELLEHIPETGEKVSWQQFDFEIVDMDGVRIDKVLVTRPGDEEMNDSDMATKV